MFHFRNSVKNPAVHINIFHGFCYPLLAIDGVFAYKNLPPPFP